VATSWIARDGIESVCDSLQHGHSPKTDTVTVPADTEAAPIRHLRSYSRYLSPRVGLFSADAWTLIAAYLRNLLLTWIVLVPALAGVAGIPLAVNGVVRTIGLNANDHVWWLVLIIVAGSALAVQTVRFVHLYRPAEEDETGQTGSAAKRPGQNQFLFECILPFTLAGVALTTAWVWVTRALASVIRRTLERVSRAFNASAMAASTASAIPVAWPRSLGKAGILPHRARAIAPSRRIRASGTARGSARRAGKARPRRSFRGKPRTGCG
jgi:hypothetical protein